MSIVITPSHRLMSYKEYLTFDLHKKSSPKNRVNLQLQERYLWLFMNRSGLDWKMLVYVRLFS